MIIKKVSLIVLILTVSLGLLLAQNTNQDSMLVLVYDDYSDSPYNQDISLTIEMANKESIICLLNTGDKIQQDCQCRGELCPNIGASCDDGDSNTVRDKIQEDCQCRGEACTKQMKYRRGSVDDFIDSVLQDSEIVAEIDLAMVQKKTPRLISVQSLLDKLNKENFPCLRLVAFPERVFEEERRLIAKLEELGLTREDLPYKGLYKYQKNN